MTVTKLIRIIVLLCSLVYLGCQQIPSRSLKCDNETSPTNIIFSTPYGMKFFEMAPRDRQNVVKDVQLSLLHSNGHDGHNINDSSPRFDFHRRDGGKWTNGHAPIHTLNIEQAVAPEILVIFLPAEISLIKLGVQNDISRIFEIPGFFWRSVAQEANGFFGCTSFRNAKGELKNFNSWLRFLIKEPSKMAVPVPHASYNMNIAYMWHRLGFFTLWTPPGKAVILCFDLGAPLQQALRASLENPLNQLRLQNPFAFHALLVEEVIVLYDAALWSCRDLIRDLEQNRTPRENPQPDYVTMHEIARHVIHASETIAVAIETVSSMTKEHEIFFEDNKSLREDSGAGFWDTGRTFRSQSTILKGLHLRSKALEERLRNEINLAFNIVAQHDSRIAVRIGEATQVDSATMQTISVLGLLFLPGTFICALFSMTFFNFNPGSDTEPQRWAVSERFWVYFAVSIPVTAVTIICWTTWQKFHLERVLVKNHRPSNT